MAPGTQTAKHEEDVTGKDAFHVCKKGPAALTTNEMKVKESVLLKYEIRNLQTAHAPCSVTTLQKVGGK